MCLELFIALNIIFSSVLFVTFNIITDTNIYCVEFRLAFCVSYNLAESIIIFCTCGETNTGDNTTQYHWDPSSIGAIEEEAASLSACVPGLGAMPNCHFRLNNVDETWAKSDTAGLHRGKDPGAGAFTDHHDRHGHAEKALDAGSEIFVSYGEVS